MSDSMLIFTIGPVQGYIAEARRAHDLWAGSQILVGVLRNAAIQAQEAGAKIIYPSKLKLDSLPNRFVARISADKDPQAIADIAERAARKQWDEYAEDARKRLTDKIAISPDWEWTKIWERQVSHYLEVYWTIAPIPDNKYDEGYKRASEALGARKSSREFAWADEDGPKDSLSGARSALWVPSGEGDHTAIVKKYWTDLADMFADKTASDYIPTILQREGRERLDAIGATKRFTRGLPQDNRFPSVSSIAAADFRRRAKEKSVSLVEKYPQALASLGVFKPGDALKCNELAEWEYDGDLLYEETLTMQSLTTDYHIAEVDITSKKLGDAQAALRKLREAVGQSPSTYYAILVMDGDHMGERVGSCDSEEKHHALSDALAGFAERATEIIQQEYAGRIVYAGGDDLLALLPLVDVLPAARKVRGEFGKRIPKTIAEEKDKKTPSISAGIAFAHHQSPLSAALQAARDAEDRAKEFYGRDALCVIALKRSGERIRVGARWDHGAAAEKGDETNCLVTDVADQFKGDPSPLASKLAFDLFAESRALANPDEAYAARVGWLVKRHTQNKLLSDQEQTNFAERIVQMASDLDKLFVEQFADDKDRPRGTVEMAQWLLIARFLVQGGED